MDFIYSSIDATRCSNVVLTRVRRTIINLTLILRLNAEFCVIPSCDILRVHSNNNDTTMCNENIKIKWFLSAFIKASIIGFIN